MELITVGTNMTNKTISPVESIPVGTKTPEPTPLTRSTEYPEQNGKVHVLDEPEPYPSLSDSLSDKKKRD